MGPLRPLHLLLFSRLTGIHVNRREDEVPSDVTALQAMDALVLIDLIGHKDPRIYWADPQVGHLFSRLVQLGMNCCRKPLLMQ